AQLPARQRGELGDRADARVVALRTPPDGQRGSPVAVAGQGPVDVVLQPLAEAPVLDVLRVPADALVLAKEVGAPFRGAHEPRRLGPVDEGRAAAPAVRIGVK